MRQFNNLVTMTSTCFLSQLTIWISLLNLLSPISAAELSADQFAVKGLELAEPAFNSFHGNMFAGLMPTTLLSKLNDASESEGAISFWLFDPSEPTHKDTIVVWMNGGPGCSSFSGCLFEHCPVTIPLHPAGFFGTDNDPKTLQPNPYAWTNATMMLYVEQPHGTGFGYGPDPQNETDVGRDFYNFIQNFYTVFEDLRAKRLFIFGESYAGMYIPSIAYYIHEQNKKELLPKINLSGVGIGNGWIDAMIQGPAALDYLWWHGLIDMYTLKEYRIEWENCIGGAPMRSPFHNFTTPDECGLAGAALEAAGDLALSWGAPNVYDVTTFDKYVTIGGNDGAIWKFYNNPLVQSALNLRQLNKTWISCSGHINGRDLLAHDRPLSMLPYIAELLDDAGIPVLVYNGDRDLLSNQPGSEMALGKMVWSGAKGWADTEVFERGLWIDSPKSVGGFMKNYKNLYLLSVYNSGHMVPFNRPSLALDMVTRFLGNSSFMDVQLPKFKAKRYERTEIDLDDVISDNNGWGKIVKVTLIPAFFLGIGVCVGVLITGLQGRKNGYQSI